MSSTGKGLPSSLRVVDHPVVSHLLTSIRDETTSPQAFRELMRRLGFMLGYEATRTLLLEESVVKTPLETCPAGRLSGPITIVPILRAGLGLADGIIDLLPDARVAHVGMYRDEEKLVPVWYYKRIPPDIAAGPAIIVDPMLATGGSVCAAIDLLAEHGCRDIRLVCLVASPEGIERVVGRKGDLQITTASIDRQLNDRGYILPGLGDAGDRLYGTM